VIEVNPLTGDITEEKFSFVSGNTIILESTSVSEVYDSVSDKILQSIQISS
jgi:hypothetical protein